jgi:hypothetical protein
MDISWLHIHYDSIPVGQPMEDDSDSWFCDSGYISKSLFSLATKTVSTHCLGHGNCDLGCECGKIA